MALTLNELIALLENSGARQYGREAVSQLEHALQCAYLAEKADETDEMIVASLLHDIGHLVTPDDEGDDQHQYRALPLLRGLFPDAVLEPIRMHVDAKRYLCHVETGYWDTLSDISRHSLTLQGGIFEPAEAAAFIAQPFAPEAVRLRRYDDQAKTLGLMVPELDDYAGHLRWVAL